MDQKDQCQHEKNQNGTKEKDLLSIHQQKKTLHCINFSQIYTMTLIYILIIYFLKKIHVIIERKGRERESRIKILKKIFDTHNILYMYNLYNRRNWPEITKIFEKTHITQRLLQLERSDFFDALSILKQRITLTIGNRQKPKEQTTTQKKRDHLEPKRTNQETSDSSLNADTSIDSDYNEAIEIRDHRSLLERNMQTMEGLYSQQKKKETLEEAAEEKYK